VAYRIDFTPAARRQLRRLDRSLQRRLSPVIDALASQSRPADARKLRGTVSAYRLRVGAYRVLYEIHDDRLLVLVIRIGHRREVHRPGE
jgi:mRNA interferase RelE/StbE